VFAGDIRKIKDVLRIKGISVNNSDNQLVKKVPGRVLVEAIVAPKSPLIGKSIRKSHFRHNYDAAVISVWREGEQLKGKVGDMVVEGGDTLLLITKPSFVKDHHTVNDKDFAWVSMVEDSVIHYDKIKMLAAIACAITLYVLTAMSVVDLMVASLVSAMAILVMRCVSYEQAWSCINASVLIVIAGNVYKRDIMLFESPVNATENSLVQHGILPGEDWCRCRVGSQSGKFRHLPAFYFFTGLTPSQAGRHLLRWRDWNSDWNLPGMLPNCYR